MFGLTLSFYIKHFWTDNVYWFDKHVQQPTGLSVMGFPAIPGNEFSHSRIPGNEKTPREWIP